MPKGVIEGIPILGSVPERWPLIAGVLPTAVTFDVAPGHRDLLLSMGRRPVTLTIASDRGKSINVSNLWILDAPPAENPEIGRITLADRRWFWQKSHVIRTFNRRRNIGTKRLRDPVTREIQPVVDDIWFFPYSLKEGDTGGLIPHTAQECFEDVLDSVFDIEFRHAGTLPKIRIDDKDALKGIPIEDLFIDDPGDEAILQVLSALPEFDLYIDLDGTVVLYSRASGKEESLINDLGPELIGRGHVRLVSNALQRPVFVDVLFTPMYEFRLDYFEPEDDFPIFRVDLEERRELEPVIDIPDFELVVPQLKGTFVMAQGTYITQGEALGAWGPPVGGITKLTLEQIRKGMVPFQDIWAQLEVSGRVDPDEDWAARIGKMQQVFRSLWRINPFWSDRFKVILPYRVSTIDQATGTRSPAQIFCDTVSIAGGRAKWRDTGSGRDLRYGVQITGYPGKNTWLKTAKPAAAKLTVDDADQGIISAKFLVDPLRLNEMILPGRFAAETIPTGSFRDGQPITFDQLIETGREVEMEKGFKAAMIVTVIPGSPNNNGQLYRIRVRPNEVRSLLPPSQRVGLNNALGPPMEVRVPASVEVARILWDDDQAETIERAIIQGNVDSSELERLVLNDDKQLNIGQRGASLNNIATSYAAQIYAQMVDRFEGEATGDFNPNLKPIGWATEVTHEITTKGETVTKITLPEKVSKLNLFGLFDPGTRAVILNLVEPRR